MPIIVYTPLVQEAPITQPKHLITMEKVEEMLSGKLKAPVRVVATTDQVGTYAAAPDLEFTYTATEALHIDGVAMLVGDRVLLQNQTDPTQNGIYTVEVAGEDGPTPPAEAAVLKRAPDFNDSSMIEQGQQVSVMEGTTQANTTWRLTTGGIITLDSTGLDFVSIAPSTGASAFSDDIQGDSVQTAFNLKHDLNNDAPVVQVYNASNKMLVLTDVELVDANNVSIGFATAPTPADVFTVVVVG